MSYQIYITEALVCGSFANNTADKSFLLFTKCSGMLYASARSVREERSRQRYALQDFSLITVSLVRGKGGWRVGSVEPKRNLFTEAPSRAVRGSIVRLIQIIRRYVRGEEPQPALYDDILTGLTYLQSIAIADRPIFEQLITVRLLYWLGYIAPSTISLALLETPFPELDVTLVNKQATVLTKLIADAESISHL